MNKRNVIEILYTDECPYWKETLKLIQDALREAKMQLTVKTTKISSIEEAKRLSFPGSPTVRINGVDIDRTMKAAQGYVGCRIYRYKGTAREFPPKEMVKSALEKMIKK